MLEPNKVLPETTGGSTTGGVTTGGVTTGGVTTGGVTTGGGGGGGGSTSSTTGLTTTSTTGLTTTGGTTTGGVLPPPERLAGDDRVATSIALSQDTFSNAGAIAGQALTTIPAGAAVLARSDNFPDALAGTPLAYAKTAPMLLTPGSSLDGRAQAEIQRILTPGKTVYLLGGTSALSPAVEAAVRALGYNVVRFAGADRYGTAAQIAIAGLGSPHTVFLATGENFPDALAGGAAAAHVGGAILLVTGSCGGGRCRGSIPPATLGYLIANPTVVAYALGGPAAVADPAAFPVSGSDRYDTARRVAAGFFNGPTAVAIASGANFPDALAGGAHVARRGGPLLLTPPTNPPGLSSFTAAYLRDNRLAIAELFVYGGPVAVSAGVRAQIPSLS